MSQEQARTKSAIWVVAGLAVVAVVVAFALTSGRGGDDKTPSGEAGPAEVVDAADLTATAAGPLEWVSYPQDEVDRVANPHDYQGRPVCQACHVDEGGALRADLNALCAGCHTWEHPSHPVNVVQAEPVPEGLPLGPGNTVLCTSCHEFHEMTKQKAGLRGDFAQLCQTCHPGY